MDHLLTSVQHRSLQPVTLNSALSPMAQAMIGLKWLLRRDGLGATSHFESGAFIRSRVGMKWADIQFHFMPLAIADGGRKPMSYHGFQIQTGTMRSRSTGWVRLKSPDPREKPGIFFNYMSHEDDWTEMRAAVRLAREVLAQPAFDPNRGEEISGTAGADRRRDRCFPPREAQFLLPSLRHLQDGRGRDGGRRSAMPRARHRRIAGGEFVDHAAHPNLQSQRTDHHDRRESCCDDQGRAAATCIERALLCRVRLYLAAAAGEAGQAGHLVERISKHWSGSACSRCSRRRPVFPGAFHGSCPPRSPIIITGAFVLPLTSVGMIEASTTRSPATP